MPAGSSTYPTTLDSFSTTRQDGVGDVINASEINELADAINKIEAELGTNPKGVFATVAARLDSRAFAFFMGR